MKISVNIKIAAALFVNLSLVGCTDFQQAEAGSNVGLSARVEIIRQLVDDALPLPNHATLLNMCEENDANPTFFIDRATPSAQELTDPAVTVVQHEFGVDAVEGTIVYCQFTHGARIGEGEHKYDFSVEFPQGAWDMGCTNSLFPPPEGNASNSTVVEIHFQSPEQGCCASIDALEVLGYPPNC